MIWAITWLIHVILLGDNHLADLLLGSICVGFQIFSLLDVWLIFLGMCGPPKTSRRKVYKKKLLAGLIVICGY